MDDSREKHIKELIEEITTGNDYCISEAVEECRTVNDVINYIVNYHGHHHRHFSEYESPNIDDAFKWLEQNVYEVDSYMPLLLSSCFSVIDLINEAYYEISSRDLRSMENKIQELIDLVHESDDEEDNNNQEKGGNP